jgi:hypothetical protein
VVSLREAPQLQTICKRTRRYRTARRAPNSKTGGCRFKSCRACRRRAKCAAFCTPGSLFAIALLGAVGVGVVVGRSIP